MKNKILVSILLLLLLPLNVFAKENKVSISCDKYTLKNNEETTCRIKAENLNFTTTSISGKIELSNNLELLESSYDNTKWKILDDKFNVKDINLISENRNIGTSYTISTFKIKATHKNETKGQIKTVNLSFGDENYESNDIEVKTVELDLIYNIQNEDVNKNPTTGDMNIIIPVICIILLLGYSVFIIKNKKEN